ncbi:LysR family transcriptional regulator [Bdellovibrio sp. SKB1291214]|uniref:LysR family transcriptional regulator n=1 Tax=Bdellovibrio sp. SKB1291214 TaxID=1732569 RepID=UPI000B516BDB|nr:LysR family transcriptional regulator [Bdellovibrio sp. SKB1291214]UYL08559.1 LysR family transcriptional regulator [Bdellovibrio sp. SKB1291214]
MTIDQLETLEMIVEKGSFKAAAEHLYKTQPSLSVAIKKLEEEFDLQLFNREEYRPKLTPEGLIFYNWAKQCLFSFRELQTVGQELGSKKVEPFLTIVLDPLVRFEAIEGVFQETILSKHPTEMTFRSEIMSGGLNSLLSGEADFSISTKSTENDNIESVFFDKIQMVPVVAKSLAKKLPNLTYKSLKAYPQIVVLQQGDKSNLLKRETKGIVADSKKSYVTDHALKHRMIMSGFGWGRLPLTEVEKELKKENLILIEDDQVKPFSLDLHIMRMKHKPMGPVARAVWEQLLRNCLNLKPKKKVRS